MFLSLVSCSFHDISDSRCIWCRFDAVTRCRSYCQVYVRKDSFTDTNYNKFTNLLWISEFCVFVCQLLTSGSEYIVLLDNWVFICRVQLFLLKPESIGYPTLTCALHQKGSSELLPLLSGSRPFGTRGRFPDRTGDVRKQTPGACFGYCAEGGGC